MAGMNMSLMQGRNLPDMIVNKKHTEQKFIVY